MKKYTQAEFDAFQVVDGVRDCPTGDYTQVEKFGEWCSFGKWCRFGASCSFGEWCSFGASCCFGASCSFGESCSFGASCSFGKWCRFGASCSFGAWCSFGASCSFGESCSFEGSHKALVGYPLLSFGGGGSVNRTIYAFNVENGPIVRAGCFVGTLDEFRAKVRKDDDRLKSLQYLGFANIVAATWCPERIEK